MTTGFSRPQRILVVDDNKDIRDLIGLALKDYRLDYAADGLEGLAAARRLRPDLVILDIMMPNLDGFGFLRAIRKDPALAFLKVLVLSARSMKEDLVAGLELGAVDYVTKPFKKDILVAKVERLLQLRFAQEIAAYQEALWRFLNHHVRTPLNLIGLSTTLFRDSPEGRSEAAANTVSLVSEGVDILEALIEQGTFLAHLLADAPRLGSVDLGPLLAELAAETERRADAADGRAIAWEIAGDEIAGGLVTGDPALLRRAIGAVLANAVDHTRPGDGIRIAAHREEGDIRLTIADTGPGVPRRRLASLFTPFRADWEAAPGYDDRFGLSLPIAQLVARLCGGDLGCQSEEGKGAVFTFRLPLAAGSPRSSLRAAGQLALGAE